MKWLELHPPKPRRSRGLLGFNGGAPQLGLYIYTELSKITWETIGVRLSTCGQQHNIEVSVSLLFYNGIIKTNHCTVHHLNDSSLHWARSIINFGGALKESQANTTLYREGPFPKNRKGAFTYRDSKPLVFSLQSFERIWEVACNVQQHF